MNLLIPAKCNPCGHPSPVVKKRNGYWSVSFEAMASPCEILLGDLDETLVFQAAEAGVVEAWRIEHKFSRYRHDNVMHQINTDTGQWVEIDAETERLLDFARQCYELSDGLFDITSGLLRRAWTFDGSSHLPDPAEVESLLPLIGLDKLQREPGRLCMNEGMELDFGGIGKEYAVDSVLQHVLSRVDRSVPGAGVLVNFGGDLACRGGRSIHEPWRVGVESIARLNDADALLELSEGAIATSGDSRRFLLKNGVRYSHILNPKTGWPVQQAPHSVTVYAGNCTLAGMLATLSMLKGVDAETFLESQGNTFWIQR